MVRSSSTATARANSWVASLLQSVRIKGFKSIADTTLSLGRVTVLVGPNNAGKSSVLQAIQFAVSIAQSLRLANPTKNWTGNVRSGSLSTQQLVYTPLRDVQALATGGVLRGGQSGTDITVRLATDDVGGCEITVKKGKNANIQVNIDGKYLAEQIEKLELPFSVVAPGLAGIPSMEEFKAAGIVRRAAARGDANSVFRNVLLTLHADNAGWVNFHESLHVVFPDVDVEVDFNQATDEDISATVVREGQRFPIDASGTGVLQAVQVLSYVYVYRPKLLILDEPDSHLHPDNQRKLARLLSGLAEELDFQILISTHSRHFLDEFASLQAVVRWFSNGEVRDGDFDQVRALLDLGALDAGDRLRNGQTPVIVVTEDQNSKYLEAVLDSSGLDRADYDIWRYSGSSQLAAATILTKFIKDHAGGTQVVVHRDRDYLTDDEVAAYIRGIEDVGAIPLVTNGTDVESHFVSVAHLADRFPEVDDPTLTDIVDRATREVRQKSIEIMIDVRSTAAHKTRLESGGPSVSPGQIATQAANDFDTNPTRFRHGKRTLKAALTLLQDEHHLSRSVAVASNALAHPAIQVIASSVTANRATGP